MWQVAQEQQDAQQERARRLRVKVQCRVCGGAWVLEPIDAERVTRCRNQHCYGGGAITLGEPFDPTEAA